MHQNFGDRWPQVATSAARRASDPAVCPVIALHCSGADGRQWRSLSAAIGPNFRILAPGLIGSNGADRWCGTHPFALMDEARVVLELMQELGRPAHIVGHSYGGAVALKIACECPASVASLTLYEPSAFHLLRHAEPEHMREIDELARAVGEGLISGAYEQAAQMFIDYWNGDGSWQSMRPDVRHALVDWLPKAPLDFHALLNDDGPVDALAAIECPVHLLRGKFAKAPSRAVCDLLASHLPQSSVAVVAGAGHMGPFTHASEVAAVIAAQIRSAATGRAPHPVIGAIAA